MRRIPRTGSLRLLNLAIAPPPPSTATPFLGTCAFSTTCTARATDKTSWIRKKLWKDEAPGPEDPYTQRPEVEEAHELPDEVIEPRPRTDRTPAAVRASRLTLPPKRTEAETEKEVQASDPNYVPAIDVEGLETIDGLQTWWDQPGHWGEESEFRGFGSPEKATERAVVEVYLRRAVVEVLALQQTGEFSQWATRKWREGGRAELDQALAVEIRVEAGKATLGGDVTPIVQSLTAEPEETELPGKMALDEARETVKAWGSSWKELTLDDAFKFALRKRLYQLTGNLIPDAKLGAARTVKNVLTLAVRDPKPHKLAQVINRRGHLPQLPNVTVHERRIGMVEKETAIGRWKVIEEELKKRDLPVTGTGHLRRSKEKHWLTGQL
ncbi:hypothetical protein CDD83_6241 [Cordyceps sp. RAO-2017]|nr:hypothetical protein CDD83_6241 [Cordyceps sp. RAO-2017]